MVFSSPLFLFAFLPTVILVYFIAGDKWKNAVLLIASLFFYAFGEPRTIFLMLLSIGINYAAGFAMDRFTARRRLFLILSIVYNLGMLFVFKYLNFTMDILADLFHLPVQLPQIALPIGISFYTFQIMSYVIDVYQGKCQAQRSIFALALYVSLFPQLIAGPIVRYVDIEKQITHRSHDANRIYDGLLRFAIGFSKKVLIADQLAPLVDVVFAGGYDSWLLHWIGAAAYTLQIYFDFSGYSDMAIGLGKIFGFDFEENFNYPYLSQSVQEFWRRWHISLSSWFRDYLYIPLGGNRKGAARTYLNLLVVFLATGLWHGASFSFLVWGLYHGAFLILERLGFRNVLKKAPRFLRHLYTLLVVLIGWVLFRANTLSDAVSYLGHMFTPGGGALAQLNYVMDGQYWFCLLAGIVCATPVFHHLFHDGNPNRPARVMRPVLVFLLFILAICYMVGSGYSPFLYFRF